MIRQTTLYNFAELRRVADEYIYDLKRMRVFAYARDDDEND